MTSPDCVFIRVNGVRFAADQDSKFIAWNAATRICEARSALSF